MGVLQNLAAEYPDIKAKYEVINQQYLDVIKPRLIIEGSSAILYLKVVNEPR